MKTIKTLEINKLTSKTSKNLTIQKPNTMESNNLTPKQLENAEIKLLASEKGLTVTQYKILDSINVLETKKAKETLTQYEIKRLVNAKIKIESKSLGRVYKDLSKYNDKENGNSEIYNLVIEMLGRSKFPTFNAFKDKVTDKKKLTFSIWNGLSILCEFNKIAKLKGKVEKQNKVTALK